MDLLKYKTSISVSSDSDYVGIAYFGIHTKLYYILWYLRLWSIISRVYLAVSLFASGEVNLPIPEFIVSSAKDFIFLFSCHSFAFAFLPSPSSEPDLSHQSFLNELEQFFRKFWDFILIPIILAWVFQYPDHIVTHRFYFPVVISSLFFVTCRSIIHYYMKLREMGDLLVIEFFGLSVYHYHTLCHCAFTFSLISVVSARLGGRVYWEPFDVIFKVATCSLYVVCTVILLVFHMNSHMSRVCSITDKIKAIEYLLGLVCYLIAQYCIQEKTLHLLVMLSGATISWLGNIAMIQPSTDFGVFNFLIYAVMDCAISLYELHKFTWITWLCCATLLIVRWKLRSVSLRYPPQHEAIIANWRSLVEILLNLRHFKFNFMSRNEESQLNREEIEEKATEETKRKHLSRLNSYTMQQVKESRENIAASKQEIVSEDDRLLVKLCRELYRQLMKKEGDINEEKDDEILMEDVFGGTEEEAVKENDCVKKMCRILIVSPCRERGGGGGRQQKEIINEEGLVHSLQLVLGLLFQAKRRRDEEAEEGNDEEKQIGRGEDRVAGEDNNEEGKIRNEKGKGKEKEGVSQLVKVLNETEILETNDGKDGKNVLKWADIIQVTLNCHMILWILKKKGTEEVNRREIDYGNAGEEIEEEKEKIHVARITELCHLILHLCAAEINEKVE